MSDLLAIGAATIDIQARAIGPVLAGTSNPVRQRDSAGGVARNIAASFALLGGTVSLVSRVGPDVHGTRLVDGLISYGVDATGVTRSDIHPTASYTALLEPDGGLFVGFSNMAVIDELNPDQIDGVVDLHGAAGIWFADANLPVETLAHLAKIKPQGVRLAVDGTSVAKVSRLSGILHDVGWLFVNRDEAAALVGKDIGTIAEAGEAALALCRSGAGAAIVLMGSDGLVAAMGGESLTLAACAAEPVSVTGAGDALIAGFLRGITAGQDFEPALKLGLACAAITVESEAGTNDALTFELAMARVGLRADRHLASGRGT